jgi:hypothetical protein
MVPLQLRNDGILGRKLGAEIRLSSVAMIEVEGNWQLIAVVLVPRQVANSLINDGGHEEKADGYPNHCK